MRVIYRDRQQGKTHDLIKICHEEGGYIVCANRRMVKEIELMAQQMGLNIPLPLTFEEFLRKQYYGLGVNKFHIDDAHLLLKALTPVHIATITLSED